MKNELVSLIAMFIGSCAMNTTYVDQMPGGFTGQKYESEVMIHSRPAKISAVYRKHLPEATITFLNERQGEPNVIFYDIKENELHATIHSDDSLGPSFRNLNTHELHKYLKPIYEATKDGWKEVKN